MKEYNPQKNKANPTMETQEAVLKEIENSNRPLTLTDLVNKTKSSIYAVKSSIEFFNKLGIIRVMASEGGITLIEKIGETNGLTTTTNTN